MSAYDRWLNEGFDDRYEDGTCQLCECDPCECEPDNDTDDDREPDEALEWGGVNIREPRGL